MENRTIFVVYIFSWCIYLVTAYIWAHHRRLHPGGVSASHMIPSAVALAMTYVFVVRQGATVAQFVAGSESGMDTWSLWFRLWPILLFAAAVSAFANLVWAIIAFMKKPQRSWVPIAIAAAVMSVFAFFTVGTNFPDA